MVFCSTPHRFDDASRLPPACTCHPLLQVNIAQFHPYPGVGLVYGTKRGRVRVFRRGDCASAVENGCK